MSIDTNRTRSGYLESSLVSQSTNTTRSEQLESSLVVQSTNITRSEQLESSLAIQSNSQRISARELHRYVWGLTILFAVFAISYPIACWRVSQSAKFRPHQSHLKSVSNSYPSVNPKRSSGDPK